jgi:hypothetical protein
VLDLIVLSGDIQLEAFGSRDRLYFEVAIPGLRVDAEMRHSFSAQAGVNVYQLLSTSSCVRDEVQVLKRFPFSQGVVGQGVSSLSRDLKLCGLHFLTSVSRENGIQSLGIDLDLTSLLFGFSLNQTSQRIGLEVKEGLTASAEVRVEQTNLIVVKLSLRVYSHTSSGRVSDLRGVYEFSRSVVNQNLSSSHGSDGIGLNGEVPGLGVYSQVRHVTSTDSGLDVNQLFA